MKVCFIGLGSIGNRHLKNLSTICIKKDIKLEVHALRSSKRQLPDEIKNLVKKEFANINEIDNEYDIIFLTNPTNIHYNMLKELVPYSKTFFIEKPVFDRVDYNIEELFLREQDIYYVACPIRFTSVISYLKELLPSEQVYSARAISSSYLPDWRPGTDYRTVYSASKEMGGGVCIDIIHEWDYINYLFGNPIEVKMFSKKLSHLEITSEDVAVYIAEYKDKFVELHLDYFGRTPRRNIEIFTKERVILADILNSRISFSDSEKPRVFTEESNDKYLREMEYFINLHFGNNNNNINDIRAALSTLRIALG